MSSDQQASPSGPALPSRTRPARQGGRHRRLGPTALPPDAPGLVLAAPGAGTPATDRVIADLGTLTAAAFEGLDLRPGYLDGERNRLEATLAEFGQTRPAGRPAAVVVPLLTGPHPQVQAAVAGVVANTGVPALVTDPLGPHPLLAEALHVRLAEAGLARADRIRLLALVTAADGVIVATTGGLPAVRAADMTAVLLAARLAVPVVPAALDGPSGLKEAADRLRATGASRLAIAPYLVGPEFAADGLAEAAAAAGAECAAPIGAHPALAQLAAGHYDSALDQLSVDD